MRTNHSVKKNYLFSTLNRLGIYSIFCFLISYSYGQDARQNEDYPVLSEDTINLSIGIDDDFFRLEEPLQITLAFDVKGFKRSRSNPEYFDATITLQTRNNNSITENIRLKARGKMRRNYCDFPPILLNLKDVDGPIAGLNNPGKLKLVTHCKESSLYEQYVLREYLVYKLYNLITPYSLKARLVQIKYVDINRPDKAYAAYGFIIEDCDNMAERNEAVVVGDANLNQNDIIPEYMVRTALFNYMIGNTDWAVPSQHNIRLLEPKQIDTDKKIPVPYDFDYSGFVNTIYAVPTDGLPIGHVKERYYMGTCVTDEVLIDAINEFEALEDKIIETIDSFQYFSKSSLKLTKSYIEKFYKMFKRKNTLINRFKNTCKRL